MEETYLAALMSELEHKISDAAAKLGDLGEAQEYVGTAADGLVTATVAEASVVVDIHVLAKRRLDRHDLGAAIVEAVNDAERQSAETLSGVVRDRDGNRIAGGMFNHYLQDVLRQLRRRRTP